MNKISLKRIAAMGLAVFLTATSLEYSAIRADAATNATVDVPVEFVSTEDGDKYATTIVTENDARVKFRPLPLGYQQSNPIFRIYQQNGQQITDDDAKNYVIYNDTNESFEATKIAALNDTSPTTYSITGNFYAVTTSGDLYESWPATFASPPNSVDLVQVDPAGGAIGTVRAGKNLAVILDSTITIQALDDETLNGSINFEVTSTNPTGVFAEFKPANIQFLAGQRVGNTKEMQISMQNKEGKSITLFITPKQKHSDLGSLGWSNGKPVPTKTNDLILKDSTFSFSFKKATSSELILSVVSPKYLVNEIAGAVGAQNSRLSYIQLTPGDDLERISKKFTLVTEKKKYGANTKIDWTWTPEDPLYQTLIRGVADGKVTIDEAALPEDDVKGKLTYTVTYTKKKADPIDPADPDNPNSSKFVTNDPGAASEIPITIKGRGKPAYIQLTDQKIGKNPPTPVTDPTKPENATRPELYTPNLMDVYQGDVDGYKAPVAPHYFNEVIYMGEKSAAANYMIITATDPDAVDVIVGSNITPYKFGEKIENDNIKGKGAVDVRVKAKTGNHNTTLTYEFYQTYNNVTERIAKIVSNEITVDDTTPNDEAGLKELEVKVSPTSTAFPSDKDRAISYGFTPEKTSYPVEVPYKGDYVRVRPVPTDELNATFVMTHVGGNADGSDKIITERDDIFLPANGQKVTVKIDVQAQNPNKHKIYILNFVRKPKDNDATLKSLEFFSEKVGGTNLLEPLEPNKFEYDLRVRFSVKRLRVEATPNSEWVQSVTFTPRPEAWDRSLFSLFQTKDCIWLNQQDSGPVGPTVITTKVTAEAGNTKEYIVTVTQDPPSEENKLKDLVVLRDGKTVLPFDESQVFDPAVPDYAISIPYTTEKISIQAPPMDQEYAQKVTLVWPDGKTTDVQEFKSNNSKVLEFKDIKIPASKFPKTFTFQIFATAESSKPLTAAEAAQNPYMLYSIEFTRSDPDTETGLKNIKMTNAEDDKEVEQFSFNAEQLEYDVEVPYLTKQIKIYPEGVSPLSKITVNGKSITEVKPYASFNLTAGKVETIKILVVAESGASQTYVIRVKRKLPNTEARLSKLEPGGGLKLNRIFVPKDTAYTVTIPEGTKGFTVTADTVDPFATFTIAGEKGTPNAAHAIKTVDPITKVPIVVTAQDGKTTKTYTLTIIDENLVVKSTNADLESLTVNYGDMAPKFKPSIQQYEVYVKDDTMSVDIIPVPANASATVEVFAGSKKLGDFDGNYSSALIEDENVFKIKVTAQDKTVTPKEYVVTVYRNNEEKKGNLKPITPDMIDYEGQNPIIVDISKYAIVSAEVLNKLKEYPDKTMIFMGNDYSFELKGSDLKTLVPNTTSFDFSMSFTSPDEDAIWEVMDEHTGNGSLEPVFVYFSHHGELPAQMKFSLSLGSKYKNKRLYWNYYNAERDRIDYYGYVQTNAKGAFAVPINHMSTYIITTKKIVGAEDKTGLFGTGENLGQLVNLGKANPNTAAKEEDET